MRNGLLREWLIGERYLTAAVAHRIEEQPDARRRVVQHHAGNAIRKNRARVRRCEGHLAGNRSTTSSTSRISNGRSSRIPQWSRSCSGATTVRKAICRPRSTRRRTTTRARRARGVAGSRRAALHDPPRVGDRQHGIRQAEAGELNSRRSPAIRSCRALPRPHSNGCASSIGARPTTTCGPRYTLALDRNRGTVDVVFAVEEGQKSTIAGLKVQGNRKTSDRLVSEQLEIETGQPLDLAALGRSRRNLYDTGAFSMVDITRTPVAPEVAAPALPSAPGSEATATGASNDGEAPAEPVKPIQRRGQCARGAAVPAALRRILRHGARRRRHPRCLESQLAR